MPKIINRGGRPPTGRVRPVQFQAEMSPDEREYLSRKVHDLREQGIEMSQNGFIIKNTFRRGWRADLDFLRQHQKTLSKKLFWTPK